MSFLKYYLDQKFESLEKKGDLIMGNLAEFATALGELATSQASTATAHTAIANALDNIGLDIAKLQALVASGTGITEAQLAPLVSQLKAAAANQAAQAQAASTMAASMATMAASVPDDPVTPPTPVDEP